MTGSVVGIDIGKGSVRAVEVSNSRQDKPTIVRYHQVELPAGAVNRGEVLEPNTVAAALKQLWSAGGFKSKRVVLGMGNHRVLARELAVPKTSMKLIREALPYQVQDLLPLPVADALLDFYPLSESAGDTGPQVNGLLIAAVKEAVLGNVQAVELAGLTPIDVDLIPFALSRVTHRGEKTDGAVVLIDVGAGTTSVVISVAGVPQFVRFIPTGGGDLTQALADRLVVDLAQAEALKRLLGLAATGIVSENPAAAIIIHEVTVELLNSLRNTVNYFINTRSQVSVTRIVLTGGGAQLHGFGEALVEMTRIPVFVPDPVATLSLGRGIDASALQSTMGTYLVALGLALGSKA
jgi:type IV pilus assembly protein PilM